MVIGYTTLLECYTLVLRRLGIRAAFTWLNELHGGSLLVNPTPDDYQEAMERIQRYPDQPITLFDAVLASLSERLTLPIWTYDYHFDVMRASIWR